MTTASAQRPEHPGKPTSVLRAATSAARRGALERIRMRAPPSCNRAKQSTAAGNARTPSCTTPHKSTMKAS